MDNILINKNGQQLGPYSLDEARELVLSGQIAATEWAWMNNATEWVPLNTIPGFSAPAQPAKPIISVQSHTDIPQEHELWSGTPSQLLNVSSYIVWIFLFSIVGIWSVFQREALWVYLLFLPFCFLHCVLAILNIRSTRYMITTQRIRVVRGILSKDVQELELFRVKDTSANQTLFLRIFGLGNITILSGDKTNPRLVLTAIPKALEMRERLRQEVLVLRQKFRVRELDVM